jgi:hypothetical protein
MAARRLAAPAVALISTAIACGLLAAPALAAAPANINLPAVRGTTHDGQMLTEQPGTWTGGSPTSVQWFDCPDASGNGCTPISAPTMLPSTYTLTDGDVGQYIMVVETATADDGSGDTATANSTPVGAVVPGNSSLPGVSVPDASGVPQDGQTVSEVAGSWAPSLASVAVQWEDCDSSGTTCSPIGSPTTQGSTYTLTDNDVGHYIVAKETATANGVSTTASSTPVGPVVPGNSSLPGVSVPDTSGVPQDGQTVSEVAGSWAPSSASVAVQWEDCDSSGTMCSPIGSPTTQGSTYRLTDNDVGQYIVAKETATVNGVSTTASSTPVGPVQPALANNSAPGIQGTAQNGQQLTEIPGSWDGAQTVTVQWYDCPDASGNLSNCTANGGPTSPGSSIILGNSDVGEYVVVQETATDFSGNVTHASSTALGPVGPPENLSPPTISASQNGQTLTEKPGVWTPNASVTVQWYDCPDGSGNFNACTPSGPATEQPGSMYPLSSRDDKMYIAVRETARAGGASFADSAPVAPSTTVLTSPAPNPAVTNQTVKLTATISTTAQGAQPSGSVSFLDAGLPIGACMNLPVFTSSQSATVICQSSFPASVPPSSAQQLTAVFTSDGSTPVLRSATTSAQSLTVNQDSATTSLDVSSTVYVGQSTTYTATVAPPNVRPGPIQPTGEVGFTDGGQPIAGCTAQPVIDGGATCTVTYATPGTHTIKATYGGDRNFTGSTSSSQNVTVVTPPAPPAPPAPPPPTPAPTSPVSPASVPPVAQVLGAISATMQWTFNYTPQYTEVLALVLNGAQQTAVTVRCAGRGCPFKNHAIVVGATHPCGKHLRRRCSNALGFNLTRIFRSHHLKVGERITVMITKPSWIGKYYRFTIRAGRGPGVHIGCLAPGAMSPGGPC